MNATADVTSRHVERARSWAAWASCLALAALLGACAESESQTRCTVTAECPTGEVCYQGLCQDREAPRACTAPVECLPGEQCVAGFCGLTDTTPDLSDTGHDTSDTQDTGTDTIKPDTANQPDLLDTIPPQITAKTPAADAMDVALTTTVTVTFSERMLAGTVTNSNFFFVKDSSNRTVPATITYDEASLTATLAFQQPLWAWSSYEVTVTPSVMDVSANPLVEVSWTFSTTAPPNNAFFDELARVYAPVFFQDVADTRRDTPVRIDFDNDQQPFNNLANLATGAFDPAVYYSVAETETNYFIHYVLYYPSYKASSTATAQAHTVNGVMVVVAKGTGRHGTLQFFETYSAGGSPGRIDTFRPDCQAGDTQAFCPTAFTEKSPGIIDKYHTVPAASFADATDPNRVRVYVRPYDHELCHFDWSPASTGYCAHDAGQYLNSNYAELRLHTAAGTPTQPDYSTTHAGTYGLHPLASVWWTKRRSSGADQTLFYRSTYTYDAPDPAAPGDGTVVPNALNTADTSSNNGLYSPWAWGSEDGFGLADGVWFIDPAFATKTRLNVPTGFVHIATKYCFNLYAGIDRTQSEAICQPAN